MSIIVLTLYIIAMVFSLCGSKYFILNYQNAQMDNIESFFKEYRIYPSLMWLFSTFEFAIITSFIIKEKPKWLYIIIYFFVPVIIAFIFPSLPSYVYNFFTILMEIICPLINQALKGKVKLKRFFLDIIKLLIAQAVSLILQLMIYVIKTGSFSFENHIMNLSATFIYALEYDIALAVILFMISLCIYGEKGGSKTWETYQAHSGSSQITKKDSRKSYSELKKNLTKTQRNKLTLFWIRFYLIQILGFLLLMVLPFLLGKVFEFLVLYLSFAIVRYILGFKYSLHFKKESLCITVGVIVFGILALAVPFFYVVLILAIVLGIALAILLHMSYKYKSYWLFVQMAKQDKFATLYVIFDGNLEKENVKHKCLLKNIDAEWIPILIAYTEGNKISYIAKKHNYSVKTIERILNELIDKLSE